MPPVEVAAARCPAPSTATAPIVSPKLSWGSRCATRCHDGSTRSIPSRSASACAPAGVEERVVLQLDGGGLYGVECAPAVLEDRPAGLGCTPQALVVGLLFA